MGRRTRTLLPTHKNLLKQPINKGTRDKLAARKLGQISHYNKAHHPLQPLKQGQAIRMKLPNATKWTLGTCTRILDNRSYEVEVSGRKYRRNRRQLRASQERPPTPPVAGVDPEQGNGEPENPSILGEPNLEHEPSLDGAPTAGETTGTLPRRSARIKYTPVWHKDYVMK